MGVHKLWNIVKATAGPDCFQMVSIKRFRGQRVIIDVPPLLFKLIYGRRAEFRNRFKKLIHFLREHEVKADWAFDGKHPETKNAEHKKRTEAKEAMQEKTRTIQDILKEMKSEVGFAPNISIFAQGALTNEQQRVWDQVAKLEMSLYKRNNSNLRVDGNTIKEAKEILRDEGETVIECEGESEATCATLNRLGYYTTVFSEDSDCIPFGAVSVVRGLSPKIVCGPDEEPAPILQWYPDLTYSILKMGYCYEKIVDLCCCLQNDFNSETRAKGLGPERCFIPLKTMTLEKFLEWKSQSHRIPAYLANKKFFMEGSTKTEDDLPLTLLQLIDPHKHDMIINNTPESKHEKMQILNQMDTETPPNTPVHWLDEQEIKCYPASGNPELDLRCQEKMPEDEPMDKETAYEIGENMINAAIADPLDETPLKRRLESNEDRDNWQRNCHCGATRRLKCSCVPIGEANKRAKMPENVEETLQMLEDAKTAIGQQQLDFVARTGTWIEQAQGEMDRQMNEASNNQ